MKTKTTLEIFVYSEQELTPRAAEVIRAILDEAYPDYLIVLSEASKVDKKVLVFGRAPDWPGVQYVYTYSIAQIMSKANALSVVAAGVRQFITAPEKVEFNTDQDVWGTERTMPIGRYMDYDKPTAIDIETDGNFSKEDTTDTVNIISVALYQPNVGGPVVIRNNWDSFGRTPPLTANQIEKLAEVLPKFEKAIYHNGKFDIRVLDRVLGTHLVNWFDTMLAHHVLNIAAGEHALKPLARRYLGAPDWEVDLKKYLKGGGHYELIPTDKLTEYNGWDVYWTYKLWEFLAPQIEADENNETAFYLEMQAAHFLLGVEQYGIPMDEEYLDRFGLSLEGHIETKLSQLRVLTGNEKFNPGSPIQVKRWLAEQGVTVFKTDEANLQKIIDDNNKGDIIIGFCQYMLEYRGLTKQKGTYVEGWKRRMRNGRVHPTFLVHGTSTGRLSSTNPNSQNVPRDKTIRKIVRTKG